ncbi:MAG: Rrf2 family transcriptional regulator [Phycisphaeraceae bacterium]|nr:Rrf2 family transcriptional regulator [Phycisphaeraceae bacterium]
MKMSKSVAYAAVALAYLATRRQEGPVQARQVAAHLEIPVDSTLKILQALARQQLLRSTLGRSGGYVLDRDPAQLTLLEVVEALDGPIQPAIPIQANHPALAACADRLHGACRNTIQQLRQALAQCTIAHLIVDSSSTRLAVAG